MKKFQMKFHENSIDPTLTVKVGIDLCASIVATAYWLLRASISKTVFDVDL